MFCESANWHNKIVLSLKMSEDCLKIICEFGPGLIMKAVIVVIVTVDDDVNGQVHIEFTEEQDQIRLEGPPEEVEQATKLLQDVVNDLV